jgi:mRNA turnover protein 4
LQKLKGDVGLLLTNNGPEEVEKFFDEHTESDYARAGTIASEDFVLDEGPLEQFPHNMETQLRQLGLPTTLKKSMLRSMSRPP